MDDTEVAKLITSTFEGVDVVELHGTLFFFYGEDRMMPFATLCTSDDNDQASDLNRPGVFRLNVGVGKDSYQSLFGTQTAEDELQGADYADYTALDRIMPHPVYSAQRWLCVLNPSEQTMQTMKPLLEEAYVMAVSREEKRQRKTAG